MVSRLALSRISFTFVLILTLFGCHQTTPTAPSTPSAAAQTYSVRGKVVSTDATHVTLDHDPVPGFMDAMTMPYQLADPTVVSELHPGDLIKATIVIHKDSSGEQHTDLDHIVVLAQGRPDYKPAVQYHVPTPGDPVPDFELLNQDNRTLHLAQFRGQVLLVTFIYTRCPLPDFCPRMTRNFAEINKALSADPKLYAETHLLSISFDPAFDTPAVLHTYGASYIGTGSALDAHANFIHWDFAVTPAKELPAVTQFFNVGVTPGDSKTLTHSLSTLIIDRNGKVAAWYPSNDWQPADLLAKVKQIVAAS